MTPLQYVCAYLFACKIHVLRYHVCVCVWITEGEPPAQEKLHELAAKL